MVAEALIFFGIGALEPEDRLLVVADHEQRAPAILGLGIAGEIFGGERVDNRPLVGIGVLRFVDQDVVGALVELVAHPIAHPRAIEQPPRPVDQVVEIGDPGGALGADIGAGERLPCPQPCSLCDGELGGRAQRLEFSPPCGEVGGEIGIIRVGRNLFGRDLAHLALAGDQPGPQAIDHRGAVVRRGGEEGSEVGDDLEAGRGSPDAVGRDQLFEHRDVDRCVGEARGEVGVGIVSVETEQLEQARRDALGSSERVHRLVRVGAFHQIGFGARLAEPEAERGDVGDQLFGAACLGVGEQGRERAAGEFGLGAAFDRAEPRRDPGFGGERAEQGLREAVDGLDAQAAAGGFEHAGEQAAGALDRRRVIGLAKREQFLFQVRVGQPHPMRQTFADAIAHLRRTGPGEGQAQDRRWRRPTQQQAQHARGQHMGLAGPGRGRQRGMDQRVGRVRLRALEGMKRLQAAGHATLSKPRRCA